jgi:hypothetical protein
VLADDNGGLRRIRETRLHQPALDRTAQAARPVLGHLNEMLLKPSSERGRGIGHVQVHRVCRTWIRAIAAAICDVVLEASGRECDRDDNLLHVIARVAKRSRPLRGLA